MSSFHSSAVASNPCDSNNCDVNAVCFPAGNSFVCECASGFEGNGFICEGEHNPKRLKNKLIDDGMTK